MWTRIKRWWEAEGAIVGLQGMSDRMLADMGLERECLRETVLGTVTETKTPEPVACGPAASTLRC